MSDGILTISEASQRYRVSRPLIRKWLYTEGLPYLKVGACTRIREVDLAEFVERNQDRWRGISPLRKR